MDVQTEFGEVFVDEDTLEVIYADPIKHHWYSDEDVFNLNSFTTPDNTPDEPDFFETWLIFHHSAKIEEIEVLDHIKVYVTILSREELYDLAKQYAASVKQN